MIKYSQRQKEGTNVFNVPHIYISWCPLTLLKKKLWIRAYVLFYCLREKKEREREVGEGERETYEQSQYTNITKFNSSYTQYTIRECWQREHGLTVKPSYMFFPNFVCEIKKHIGNLTISGFQNSLVIVFYYSKSVFLHTYF